MLQVYVLLSRVLKLDGQTLEYHVYQLTWTLPLRAPAEKVECASRTVEDGGRERVWSGCKPKPVSTDQIQSTHATQNPRAHETASSIVYSGQVDAAAGNSTQNRFTMESSTLLLSLKACSVQQLLSWIASTGRHRA